MHTSEMHFSAVTAIRVVVASSPSQLCVLLVSKIKPCDSYSVCRCDVLLSLYDCVSLANLLVSCSPDSMIIGDSVMVFNASSFSKSSEIHSISCN